MAESLPPVIVIGMHRSGTTMLTEMLRRLGLFVGWDLQGDSEALFFAARNERLLRACNGSWERPEPVDGMLRHADRRGAVAQALREDIASARFLWYLGFQRYWTWRRRGVIDFPWGWKDPRNTFLLPLWLDLFPQARLLHIHRNGVDVALSLATREERRIGRAPDRPSTVAKLGRQWGRIRRLSPGRYLVRNLNELGQKLDPLKRYDRLEIHPCLSLEQGFDTWRRYVERATTTLESLPNPSLTVGYEDFLQRPADCLAGVAAFCGLSPAPQLVRELTARIDPTRRFAFCSRPEGKAFYERTRDDPWMVRLGYRDIRSAAA